MTNDNKVVRILMERDGLTKREAEVRLDEVRVLLDEADPFEAESIIADELGLELDYLFDILF